MRIKNKIIPGEIDTKLCSKCLRQLELCMFSKDSKSANGLSYNCKECLNTYAKLNRHKHTETEKRWIQKNKEKVNEYRKKYYLENKEKIKQRASENYYNNHERRKQTRRNYFKNNRPKVRAKQKEYVKFKTETDPMFRIKNNLRKRIHNILIYGWNSPMTTRLTGCSTTELKQHLESKFRTGMTWNNYGVFGWHVDHIMPIVSFDLSKEEEQIKCFHYTNLQPLWATTEIARENGDMDGIGNCNKNGNI